MPSLKHKTTVLLLLVVPTTSLRAQETSEAEHQAMYQRYLELPSRIKSGAVQPHWMADGSSFWFAEGGLANTVIYKVDPKANTKVRLFDSGRVRSALANLLGHEMPGDGLPFREFTFRDGERAVMFTLEKQDFVLELGSYTIQSAPARADDDLHRLQGGEREMLSPDHRWFAGVEDENIYLRSTHDGKRVQLTHDGLKSYSWSYDDYFEVEGKWSLDSRYLAALKIDGRGVDTIPIVHWLTPRVAIDWQRWRWTGPLDRQELYIIDLPSRRSIRVSTGDDPEKLLLILGWQPDGSALYFLRMDREHKKLELMAANPVTGASRTVLTETSKTFVDGFRLGADIYGGFSLLPSGKAFLWTSERSGWKHLYLYNITGSLVRPLTSGSFPVVRVLTVDEKAGWVYFLAHSDTHRPYDTHICRVDLEGNNFAQLTHTAGQHIAQFSPAAEYFLDWTASVHRPGETAVRSAGGKLVQVLTTPDTSFFAELRWRDPEEFVVKAADGKTDLYGVLYKPYDFNPDRKYPVIDVIYGDPCCAVVPQRFASNFGSGVELAQIGFITFVVDGRGTPERGKAFQDVVYGNMGRAEIADHVAALKELATTRGYMDLARVGVTGYSSGGHFALRGMLQAPDVYQVGVAGAPVTDIHTNDVMKFMGEPQRNKDAYDYGSDFGLAGNLKGRLLIIHGTSDVNVPFSSTIRMLDAFERAGKFVDLIVIPDADHASANPAARGEWSAFVRDATRRYFVQYLRPD